MKVPEINVQMNDRLLQQSFHSNDLTYSYRLTYQHETYQF